jgi:bifunctional DNase/RNase
MEHELNLIEMELREVQIKLDPAGEQVIVLGEKHGTREFPIFIGAFEATALHDALHRHAHKRPLTHELVGNVIAGLGGRLNRVIVDDLRENTYFGKLAVRSPLGSEELIDSRPSDAIVMAVRLQAPIFVAEEVLERAARPSEE